MLRFMAMIISKVPTDFGHDKIPDDIWKTPTACGQVTITDDIIYRKYQ